MSGENWTPGPWFHEKGLIYNRSGDEVGVTPDWCNADRDLALAAPDMYEALKEIYEQRNNGRLADWVAQIAPKVLAKARGEEE